MRRPTRLALIGGLLITMLAIPVVADTYPGTANGDKADGYYHTACWVPDPGASTIPWALWEHVFGYMDDEVQTATGLDIVWQWSCDNTIDMRLDDRLANNNYLGLRWCQVAIVNGICGSSNVQINDSLIQTAAANAGHWVESVRQHNWCHESGHSLGLGHYSWGCLKTGVQTDITYDAHHIDHIANDLQ